MLYTQFGTRKKVSPAFVFLNVPVMVENQSNYTPVAGGGSVCGARPLLDAVVRMK